MSPELGKAALQIALWCVIVAAALLPFLPRGSAEFIITAVSLLLGLGFAVLVWFLVRRGSK